MAVRISKAPEPEKKVRTVKLGNLSPGDAFRFAETPFEDAIGENPAIFLRVAVQPEKTDRIPIVALDGKGTQRQCDPDRLVVLLDVELFVREP